LLFLLVAGVFLPALRYDFLNYDDPGFVTDNVHVQELHVGEREMGVSERGHRLLASVELAVAHGGLQLFGLHPWDIT